jgi:hypothetical protein
MVSTRTAAAADFSHFPNTANSATTIFFETNTVAYFRLLSTFM